MRLDDLTEDELLQQAAERALTVSYAPEGEIPASPIGGSMAALPESAARRPLQAATPELQTERVVQVQLPKMQTATPRTQGADDLELAMAKAEDRRARKQMAMERAGRELVAGLTRTTPQSTIAQPTDAVKQLLALRAQQRAAEAAAVNRQMGERKLSFAEQEAKRKAEVAEHERTRKAERQAELDKRHSDERVENKELAERRLAASIDNAAANRELARASLSIRQDEADVKREERSDKQAAGEIPLFDGVLRLNPGLSDTERNKAREVAGLWNAADAATGELERALEAYVANPSRETFGAADSLVAGASTALNAAYGQGAMANDEAARMKSTLGSDLTSPRAIEAAIRGAIGDPQAAGLLLSKLRAARAANRASAKGRLRTYESARGGSPVASGGGKVRVSNGSQTFEVDESDVAAAEADGFKRVR